MKKVDRHGLVMKGLRKAAGRTIRETARWAQMYIQIDYNIITGEVLTHCHFFGNYYDYQNSNILCICHTDVPLTMQEIADSIAQEVKIKKLEEQWAS